MADTPAQRRAPVFYAVAGILVAGAVAGSLVSAQPSPALPGARAAEGLPANGLLARAIGSTWSCAGATPPGGKAPGGVTVINAGASPARADVQLIAGGGWARLVPVMVPPGSERTVAEQGPSSGSWVGAIVTAQGSEVAATQQITTRWGTSVQPCASTTSTRWYFASGAVRSDASEEITLVNPYHSEAVVKLTFTTEQGLEEPADFASVAVPPLGTAAVDVGSHLRRRRFVAATVQAVSGRVAAFRTELVTAPAASGRPAGATLALGVPRASRSSWFPLAGQGAGRTETFWFYNPGTGTARVTLSLHTGQTGGPVGRTSFTLGPRAVRSVVTNGQPWALPGTAYSAGVLSTQPVVAERDVAALASSGRVGSSSLDGAAAGPGSRSWLVPSLPGWQSQRTVVARGTSRGALVQPVLWRSSAWPMRSLFPQGLYAPLSGSVGSRAASNPPASAFADVLNPGPLTVKVYLQPAGGRGQAAAPVGAALLAPGATTQLALPVHDWGTPLLVRAADPVVVSLEAYSPLRMLGSELAPAVEIGG